MQFSLAVVAALLSAVSAVPSPQITPAPEVPAQGGQDDTCPASKTITSGFMPCPMIRCASPIDGPCTPLKTVTVWEHYSCQRKPPTTTTVRHPCPPNGCSCPKATVTAFKH